MAAIHDGTQRHARREHGDAEDDAEELAVGVADRAQRRILRQLPGHLRRQRLIEDHRADDDRNRDAEAEDEPGRGARAPERLFVARQLLAREHPDVCRQDAAKLGRGGAGVGAGAQRDEAEGDVVERAVGEDAGKVQIAGGDDAEASKAGA